MLRRYLRGEHFRRWVGKYRVLRKVFCVSYLPRPAGRPAHLHGPIVQGLGDHGEESGFIQGGWEASGVTWSDFHCGCRMEQ